MTTDRPLVTRTQIELERVNGATRRATLPAGGGQITYGVHGEIAAFYDVDTSTIGEHPSPLDHLVAAVGAALIGGFGRALTQEGIDCEGGRLTGTAVGDVEDDGGVLFIPRIRVIYHLVADPDVDADAVGRALEAHFPACPLTRTLGGCIDLVTELDLRSAT